MTSIHSPSVLTSQNDAIKTSACDGIIPLSPFTVRPNSLCIEVFIQFQKHKATTNSAEHALEIYATPIFLYMLLSTVNLPLNKPVTLYIILSFIC